MNNKDLISILVTGGAGFIGSNFIPYFLEEHEKYKVINLDKLTYAGNLENLKEVENSSRYEFVRGDICNKDLVAYIFEHFDIKGVLNFAAESHVDNSITGPDIFIKTNVYGTFNLLDNARNYWMDSPSNYKDEYKDCRFLHVSTDEVYGTLGKEGFFTEETPYAPNSPYSASKAASDFIVRSFYHTYGLNVITTNCSNNYGPKQHDEKFIPTIIRKALAIEKIPVYGQGKNIRDWLYVLDHCKGIDAVFHKGKPSETYNIGCHNEYENINLAYMVCKILDELAPEFKKESKISSYEELIGFVTDRPGHDKRYAIDPTKIKTEIGWKECEDFESGLRKTVQWYLNRR
ncbi:MAG: dTDP-glucose 4,6-dehydratase [Cyanobacteriota bacterium]